MYSPLGIHEYISSNDSYDYVVIKCGGRSNHILIPV